MNLITINSFNGSFLYFIFSILAILVTHYDNDVIFDVKNIVIVDVYVYYQL